MLAYFPLHVIKRSGEKESAKSTATMLNQASTDLPIPTALIEAMRNVKNGFSFQAVGRVVVYAFKCVSFLRNIPEVEITIDNSVPGQQVGRFLRSRFYGFPVQNAASVLILPRKPTDYLKGRKKQSVRTNIARAKESGFIVSKDVGCDAFWSKASRSRVKWAANEICAEKYRPGMEDWCVCDAEGEIHAIARIQVHNAVAILIYLCGNESQTSGFARSQLSAAIFMDLSARAVECVVVGSVFDLTPGLAYFQSRLGFESMWINLIVSSGRNATSSVASARSDILRSQ